MYLTLLLAVAPVAELGAVVEPIIRPLLAGRKNSAVAVGIWRAGRPAVFGYGTAHTRLGDLTPGGETVFAVGSVSKGFTGLLLAEAVRRGEVRLEDPINNHLPAGLRVPQVGRRPVTLADLAIHRSGLPRDVADDPADPANPFADLSPARLAAAVSALQPPRPPGWVQEYSNLGAGLVGEAVVWAAGAENYHTLFRERVGRPFGLADTGEALTGEQAARRADGFVPAGYPTPHFEFATLASAGSLNSTASDLLRFAAAAVGDRPNPLSAAWADCTRPRAGSDDGDRIGLFWELDLADGRVVAIRHSGATFAHSAELWLLPADRAAVVLLSARQDDRSTAVARRLAAAIGGGGR